MSGLGSAAFMTVPGRLTIQGLHRPFRNTRNFTIIGQHIVLIAYVLRNDPITIKQRVPTKRKREKERETDSDDGGDDGSIREEATLVFCVLSKVTKERRKQEVERTKYRTPSHQTTQIPICLPCSPVLPAPYRSGEKYFQHTPSSRPPHQRNFTKCKQSHLNLVDLIKTSAVKTLWEKHMLVGKRVPTHACRQDARTRSTRTFIFFQLLITRTPSSSPKNRTPFSSPKNRTPLFCDQSHSLYSDSL